MNWNDLMSIAKQCEHYEVNLGIECCGRSKEALAANENPNCDCRVCRLFVKKEN